MIAGLSSALRGVVAPARVERVTQAQPVAGAPAAAGATRAGGAGALPATASPEAAARLALLSSLRAAAATNAMVADALALGGYPTRPPGA